MSCIMTVIFGEPAARMGSQMNTMCHWRCDSCVVARDSEITQLPIVMNHDAWTSRGQGSDIRVARFLFIFDVEEHQEMKPHDEETLDVT
eukprot:2321232-Amphidinium_carterae.1